MGYNIGTRLIEDFLARSGIGRCADFKDVGEVVAKVCKIAVAFVSQTANTNFTIVQVGFKSFLNITPNVTHSPAPPTPSARPSSTHGPSSSGAGSSFTLTLDENPLAEFVELPEDALEGGLWFSNVLCGVLRGSLEMVSKQQPFMSRTCELMSTSLDSNAGTGRVYI